MKQSRLALLAAAALALGAIRWQFPPRQDGTSVVVGASERSGPKPSELVKSDASALATLSPAFESSASRPRGNAFSVRIPEPLEPATLRPAPAPIVRARIAASPPPPHPAPAPAVPPPPPPLVPPFKVMGTWDDASSPGVFVVGASDVVLARLGSVLMSEYRVTGLTREHLSLLHLPSNQTLQLNIPRTAPR